MTTILAGCGGEDDVSDGEVEAAVEPTVTPTLESRRSEVVRELRTLMEIETAVHSVETVVEAEADGGFLSSDSLLLVAHGHVTAGVDLTYIGDANVEVIDYKTIRVMLPDSVILASVLDQNQTQVVSRDTGLLSSEDESLEEEAIEEAEIKILQSACDHAILDRAASEAEARILALLNGLEFETVTVVAQAGTCP